MGTLITITLYAPDAAVAKSAAAAAFQRIDALEDIMSDYQADSELMRLCDQPFGTPVPVSNELFYVLQRAQKMSKLSDGAFDVTVGPYVRLWRFARKRKVLPDTRRNRGCAGGGGMAKAPAGPARAHSDLARPEHAAGSGQHRQRLRRRPGHAGSEGQGN